MDAPVNMKQHAIERLIIDNVTQSGAPVGIEWDTPEFEIASDFRFPVYGLAERSDAGSGDAQCRHPS